MGKPVNNGRGGNGTPKKIIIPVSDAGSGRDGREGRTGERSSTHLERKEVEIEEEEETNHKS